MIGGVCNASDGVVLPPRARAQRCYPKFAITSTVGGLRSSEGGRPGGLAYTVMWRVVSRVSRLGLGRAREPRPRGPRGRERAGASRRQYGKIM